jgi:hypothetical protein
VGADLHDAVGGAGRVDHGATFHDGVPDRLLDVDVRAGRTAAIIGSACQWSGVPNDGDLGLRLIEQFAVVLEAAVRRRCRPADRRCGGLELAFESTSQRPTTSQAAGHRLAQDVVAPPAAADEGGAKATAGKIGRTQ